MTGRVASMTPVGVHVTAGAIEPVCGFHQLIQDLNVRMRPKASTTRF
jgi:hypothetical protein